jgi:hypothetical protein
MIRDANRGRVRGRSLELLSIKCAGRDRNDNGNSDHRQQTADNRPQSTDHVLRPSRKHLEVR